MIGPPSLSRVLVALLCLSSSVLALQKRTDVRREAIDTTVPATADPRSIPAAVLDTSIEISNGRYDTTGANVKTTIPFLRGVNLGGWLVLERWMDDVFTGKFADAVDQWTFDSIPGALAALEMHWSTWFTEDDIKAIAATGINALRIPIGYWAYLNVGTPYIQGADAYLDLAITWARKFNMKVWIDCHGSPGSQNGFDSSGHAGAVEWQTKDNLQRSILALELMALKYGGLEYADVVVGIELINEPISWWPNDFEITKSWAKDAYKAVKAVVANKDLIIVMHDGFRGPPAWISVAKELNADHDKPVFGIDTHLYQVYGLEDNMLTQKEHIEKACRFAPSLAYANKIMPTFVGEWTSETNICVDVNGVTMPGTSCSSRGCQCQSAHFTTWRTALVEEVRRYVEAQLDVFEESTSGYFMWAAKGPGGWGFLNGIRNGAIPNPVTSRKFPKQCNQTSNEGKI